MVGRSSIDLRIIVPHSGVRKTYSGHPAASGHAPGCPQCGFWLEDAANVSPASGEAWATGWYCFACKRRFGHDEVPTPHNRANVIPLALMCGGWLAPLILFWLAVAGPLRPFHYPQGALTPSWLAFAAVVLLCILAAWLPRGYDRIFGFERSGRIYTALGVRAFRKWVPDGDCANRWKRRRVAGHAIVRGRADARSLLQRTRQSERAHLMWLFMGVATAAFAGHIGWWGWALYLSIGNVLVNLYPVLLQRYTRTRLQRLTRAVRTHR